MEWGFSAVKATSDAAAASPTMRFAFKLFNQIAADANRENSVLSPASVMLCVGMLLEGATGETREAIARTLEVADLGPEAMSCLTAVLRLQSPGVELFSANALWYDEGFTPKAEFVAKVREHFEAEIKALSFARPESVDIINRWVSEQTRGKIPQIQSELNPENPMIATNAIYFKGLWDKPFEKEFTREDIFHTGDARKLKVPLMGGWGKYLYREDSDLQAVRLAYKNSSLAMYIFLPDKSSSLQAVMRKLSPGAWQAKTATFNLREGNLRLPRFQVRCRTNLSRALARIGMEMAFDPQRAELKVFNKPANNLWIGEVLHQVLVDVNEEGTEAAALTELMVYGAALRPPKRPKPFEMVVDRPFFFAICDDYTHTMLFMGVVNDPLS